MSASAHLSSKFPWSQQRNESRFDAVVVDALDTQSRLGSDHLADESTLFRLALFGHVIAVAPTHTTGTPSLPLVVALFLLASLPESPTCSTSYPRW